MDFEYTFWLMLQLCISPKTAYRHTSYHKQTKNQWARDDPAFVVVLCLLVALAATAYCVTYGDNLWHSLLTILSAVIVDCLLLGIAISTACWFIANRFLRKKNLPQHQVEQHLEWLYAFDVHCNSYFPLFLLLYVLQFLGSPFLLWKSFVSGVVSCVLYAVVLAYYHYLNFLGYSALPFLERTECWWVSTPRGLCSAFTSDEAAAPRLPPAAAAAAADRVAAAGSSIVGSSGVRRASEEAP
uniref:UNC-50 family protein n=1 Tax=Tetradesmus obliquus TaxID=3088 RepID=A0A383WCT6_TETOB|eukprot:jgi/Sobl393_1/1399/SZX75040.1